MQISANGMQIEVDDQGPPNGPPLLLIMGLGMQLIGWPQDFVNLLVARGLRVIRFDNRDVGLSQRCDAAGMPRLWRAMLRHQFHLPVTSPAYSLADMAADAAGVLDALGLASAHVCGASMGGMVAQHLAARHPQRLRSLTLLMSTSGARHLPPPKPAVQMAKLQRPRNQREDELVAYKVRFNKLVGSPGYPVPEEVQRQRQVESVRRCWYPEGTARQFLAVVADGDRTPLLGRIRTPTLVLHGEADPLVPVPAAHDLAAKIAGAKLETIPGMGHDLPPGLLPRLAKSVADHALAQEPATATAHRQDDAA